MILIAVERSNSSPWWNAYDEDEEILSDYFLEISRGKLHVVAPNGAFSVVLSHEANYYPSTFGSRAQFSGRCWCS